MEEQREEERKKKLQNPIIFWRILRRCLPLRYHHDLFCYFFSRSSPLFIPFMPYRCIRCSIFLCLFKKNNMFFRSFFCFVKHRFKNTVGPLFWEVVGLVYLAVDIQASRARTHIHTLQRCEAKAIIYIVASDWVHLSVHRCANVDCAFKFHRIQSFAFCTGIFVLNRRWARMREFVCVRARILWCAVFRR